MNGSRVGSGRECVLHAQRRKQCESELCIRHFIKKVRFFLKKYVLLTVKDYSENWCLIACSLRENK